MDDDTKTEPQVLRIAQPQCQGLIYFNETVVMQCSQPAGHASMPGHPTPHSIVIQWTEDVAHVNGDGK